jgi:FAD/FMN-containing dehydrogenase
LGSAAELMKRVKQELDPAGRLPAGRFFASNGSAV